jgi:hypothetical protein
MWKEYTMPSESNIGELFILLVKNCEEELKKLIGHEIALNRIHSEIIFSLDSSLDVMYPEECKKSVQNLLWKVVDNYEKNISLYTAGQGWNYSLLSFDALIGLKAIISTGYLPIGSDSKELYNSSLVNYPKLLEGKMKKDLYRGLWELTSYIELLLTYHKIANNTNYQKQLDFSMLFLLKTIENEDNYLTIYNIQQIGFIGYIVNEYLMEHDNQRLSTLLDDIKTIIGNTDLWPDVLLLRSLLLYDLIKINNKIDTEIDSKYQEIIENYQSLMYQDKMLKVHILKLITEFSKCKDIKYQIPYLTSIEVETSFFGITIETLLDTSNHLEAEKSGTKLNYQETDLRNLFSLPLKTRFNRLATAESYVVGGLTDIYVTNPENTREHVVIECKIYRGIKGYQDAITQTMKYLQVNDNRAILLTFIKNTKYIETLKDIQEAIETHSTYQEDTLREGIFKANTSWGKNYYSSVHKAEGKMDVKIHHIYVDIREQGIL